MKSSDLRFAAKRQNRAGRQKTAEESMKLYTNGIGYQIEYRGVRAFRTRRKTGAESLYLTAKAVI